MRKFLVILFTMKLYAHFNIFKLIDFNVLEALLSFLKETSKKKTL